MGSRSPAVIINVGPLKSGGRQLEGTHPGHAVDIQGRGTINSRATVTLWPRNSSLQLPQSGFLGVGTGLLLLINTLLFVHPAAAPRDGGSSPSSMYMLSHVAEDVRRGLGELVAEGLPVRRRDVVHVDLRRRQQQGRQACKQDRSMSRRRAERLVSRQLSLVTPEHSDGTSW